MASALSEKDKWFAMQFYSTTNRMPIRLGSAPSHYEKYRAGNQEDFVGKG